MATETKPAKWTPAEISDANMAFPANVMHLMPSYEQIPREFKGNHPMTEVTSRWFFRGLPKGTTFVPREGVDRDKALRHIKCILGSFEPKHEHKEAGVSFLLNEWFSAVNIPDAE